LILVPSPRSRYFFSRAEPWHTDFRKGASGLGPRVEPHDSCDYDGRRVFPRG